MATRFGLAVICILAMPCGSAIALDPGDRCEADKHKTIARYLSCRHKAIANVVKFGDSGAPYFGRCELKFSKKWQRAEDKGGPACPTVGDETAIKAMLDQVTTATSGFLEGPTGADLLFAGYPWIIKQSSSPVGPGPNRFSDRPEDVWVDADGLHLTISQQTGLWWSSEVILDANLGYGTYVFHTESRIDTLDANMVLGLFTWDTFAPPNYREIDFEFSRWGNPSDVDNAQFVVQPYTTPSNIVRYRLDLNEQNQKATHVLVWSPGQVDMATYLGHHLPSQIPPFQPVFSWTNTGPDVPLPGGENVRMNLWLVNGNAPMSGQPEEVVISNFLFAP